MPPLSRLRRKQQVKRAGVRDRSRMAATRHEARGKSREPDVHRPARSITRPDPCPLHNQNQVVERAPSASGAWIRRHETPLCQRAGHLKHQLEIDGGRISRDQVIVAQRA